jgi:hypothetical protein
LTIYRPGLLLNRRGEYRFGEKCASWVPGISKIESADMGKAMIEKAVAAVRMSEHPKVEELNNAQIRASLQVNVKL